MENTNTSRRLATIVGVCLLSILVSACSSSDDDDTVSSNDPINDPTIDSPGNETPDNMQDPLTLVETPTRADLQGVWEQTGYGFVVQINDEGIVLFDFTRASCLQFATFGNETLDEIIETASISADGMSLETKDPAELFSESYARREALPDVCEPDNLIEDPTPTVVFDHFWHTFNDYYAFFAERQVDWEAQRATYRPQVNNDMTDEQLFQLLSEMIDPLDDGHVSLVADTDVFQRGFSPADDASVFKAELAESFNQQTEFDDIDDYLDFQLNRAREVTFQSVSNLNQAGLEIEGDVPAAIYWGTLDNNVGYINITRMLVFGDTFDVENGDLDDLSLEDDLQALNAILDRVLADLQDTSAMVIDVRSNGGGTDSASMEIVNRFATDELQVISKFARSFDGETAIKQAFTTPTATPYTSPIVVLSSLETASAAEIFLMAMNSLPNVTLVGDESTGELSDILGKELPNGWQFGLSNEVYSDFQDRRFEVIGVPMDTKIKALSLPDIEQGIDSALIEALASF